MKKYEIYTEDKQYIELSAPFKMYYDITTNCNLDCVFCFKGKNSVKSVSFDDSVKKVIKNIADANVMDLVFLGGEPLAYAFLFDALVYAKSCGLNVGIITNGTLFTEENVKKLKDLVNNSISVSVHAHTNELHDRISRGENVLDKIISGLHILNKFDITPELAFTPVKSNIHHLYDTISNILDCGIKISDVLVNRLIPAGNALSSWNDKEVTLPEQLFLFEQMEQLTNSYPELKIATGDAIPFCVVDQKYWKYIVRCDYAITLGWINEDNLFGKCMCRGSADFDSLDNHSIKELWKTSKTFLDHRCLCNVPNECQECDWISLCGGGCACSSIDSSIARDAFLNNELGRKMPPLPQKLINNIDSSVVKLNLHDCFNMCNPFVFRQEKEFSCSTDAVFLLIPLSSGAIIQDVILPENGEMIWVNSIEKQIVLYMQTGLDVFQIGKSISYEFAITLEEALSIVEDTIVFLIICNMVEKK